MKKTRILFSLLMAVVMMAMSPQTLWALGGSGTSSSPYTIASASDLATFASKVNGSEQGAYAKLTADITLTSAWTAMGTSSKPYTGTFDGQGHKISGLNHTATAANAGLFGCVNGATIKNFSLAGTVSSGYDNTGSVVGYAKGSSTIQDIVSTVNITMTSAKNHLGGIAGNIENGTSVLGCTYSGTLNAGSSTDSNGGIVGFANANCSGTIKYCFFNGTITTTSSTPVIGGILGYTNDESKNFGGVQDCYSCGTLSFGTSDYKYANAIVGRIRKKSSTTINNTFLSGTAARACNEDCDEKVDFTKNKAITISVTASTGGSVSQTYINPTSTTAIQLQVTATPAKHYNFESDSWSDNGAQTHSVGLTTNVNLYATFIIDEHSISIASYNDISGGSFGGRGYYPYGSTTTIEAFPNEHYTFKGWTDGNIDNPRTITVTEDKLYVGIWQPVLYNTTVNVANGQSSMGTVSGNDKTYYHAYWNIKATPNYGYHFVRWNDDNTENPRSIYVTGDETYTAFFAPNQYTITAEPEILDRFKNKHGTVEGGGTYDYGTQQTITATPYQHYQFSHWNDGNTENPRTITVNGNTTYVAYFAPKQYTITVTANNSDYGTVTGGGQYDFNTDIELIAKANPGYHFVQWNDGYRFTNYDISVVGDAEYIATFAPSQYTITVASADESQGTVTGGGTFDYKSLQTITATPKIGYHFVEWNDGNTNASRQISVTGNATYTASFEPNVQAKAVLNNETLTFYYDNSDHAGTVYQLNTGSNAPEWSRSATSITSVVFDETFADARPTSCYQWFQNCRFLESITGIEYLNTEEVTNMQQMFASCYILSSIDLSHFNTAKVENMSSMFYNCWAFTSLNFSSFNTVSVTNMESMFEKCSSLTSLDLSNFNTEKVTDMNSMFMGLNLTSLNLSSFNTEKVKYMNDMFNSCPSLTSLDLSSFNTSSVLSMSRMFRYCYTLQSLVIVNFDMRKVVGIGLMFEGCNNLNMLTLKSVPFLKDGTFNTQFAGAGKTVNYELDENSAIYTDGTNNLPAATSATYNRAGIKNQWGTIVVPFELNGSGDDYDLYTLSEASSEELTLTKVNGTLPASTPALIRLKDGLAGNYNLTITAADPAVTTQMEEGSSADGLQLVGTYEATQLTANDYFIANNKFWLAGDMSAPVKAAPFRAYLKNTGAGAKASALNIAVEDDSATAIDALNMLNDTDTQYYDLNGRRIPQLQKGINIVKMSNGKTVKVSIK